VSFVRVRAPELVGRGWPNTGGDPLSLADLRGRVVVLDFWTLCCVNCLHVLDELRPLEAMFPDSLVLKRVGFIDRSGPLIWAAGTQPLSAAKT